MDTKALLDLALSAVNEGGTIALDEFRLGRPAATTLKADGSVVTNVDIRVERLIRDRILAECPSDQILGEELGSETQWGSDRRWFVDPIDGTAFYARGETNWGVLLSVQCAGRIEVGVISMPALGWHWWAARGLRAHSGPTLSASAETATLSVSRTSALDEATVLIEEAALEGVRRSWLDNVREARVESPLIGPGAVAAGNADAMIIGGAMPPWEVAPLVVLIEEAGGQVTDFTGAQRLDAPRCVLSNGLLHPKILTSLADERPSGSATV